MNSQKITDLLLNGAFLDIKEHKLHHASFRKGWVKMGCGNISFIAATKKIAKIGKEMKIKDGKYFCN
jgi:hypothetical protein